MATVELAGETFEAGASILHPKNFHALNFTKMLNLSVKKPPSSESSLSLWIWDGEKFVFKTLESKSKSSIVQKIVAITNSMLLFVRYGFSLFKMDSFVEVSFSGFLCLAGETWERKGKTNLRRFSLFVVETVTIFTSENYSEKGF